MRLASPRLILKEFIIPVICSMGDILWGSSVGIFILPATS